MGWVVVTGVVVLGLAAAFDYRRRNRIDVVATLELLVGQEVDLAIAPVAAKRTAIGEYTGVIASVDRATGRVMFEWITRLEGGHHGSLSTDALLRGSSADCIQWVRPVGHSLIDLK